MSFSDQLQGSTHEAPAIVCKHLPSFGFHTRSVASADPVITNFPTTVRRKRNFHTIGTKRATFHWAAVTHENLQACSCWDFPHPHTPIARTTQHNVASWVPRCPLMVSTRGHYSRPKSRRLGPPTSRHDRMCLLSRSRGYHDG